LNLADLANDFKINHDVVESDNLNAVGCDQNINLTQRRFETFFEVFEELLCYLIPRSSSLICLIFSASISLPWLYFKGK